MRRVLACIVAILIGLGAVSGSQFTERNGREFSYSSFPADLSEAALVERFGAANVRRALVVGADDGPQEGAAVHEGSAMKIEMTWWDADARTRLAWVTTREPNSPWRTPNGITIGMDLVTIERRNGWPFRLRGLAGPEGRGIVRSWGRGHLESSDSDGCRLSISLQPTGERRVDPALYGQVALGREFSSGHPAMQAINPQVVDLIVSHDPVPRRVDP
jgi:hypothetical protein